MTEVVLSLCRDTNLKVHNILQEYHNKKEDVTEFITTIQLVQITINGLLKSKKEFSFEALKELQHALKEYESELLALNGAGKLLRFFANTRLRRKLEHMNSLVHGKLEALKESIQQDEKPANPTETSPESSSAASSAAVVGQVMNTAGEEEIEGDLLFMIEDEDGKVLWWSLYGKNSFMISRDTFITGLKKVIFDLKEDEIKVLLYILDNSNTGFINQHKFSEFLKGFGPVTDCVRNMKSVLSCPWFFGFLSRQETEVLLRDQPAGTFLIRFSSTQPGSFALAFSNFDQTTSITTIAHILVKSAKPLGFVVHEQDSNTARTFRNLYELVDFYSLFLLRPFMSDLPFESFFEGDVSGEEAIQALSGHPQGTFLVRFSKQVGSYAISYVAHDGSISHALIEHDGNMNGCYHIATDNQVMQFQRVVDVVRFYGDSLKFPLKNATNELAVDAAKIMTSWKRERASQMEEVSKIVHDIFDINNLAMTQVLANAIPAEKDPRVHEIISRLFTSVQ